MMPQVWIDYGNIPHIHQMERANLDSKTKCLAFISAYLMRTAPKIAPHWVINAKELGATDKEILEAAIVAVEATAKAKMAEVDQVMTEIMNSPGFLNAKVIK
jgi:alkylhydroperoxidase/carboxymuconolactone decarboxylase family protein YurZ